MMMQSRTCSMSSSNPLELNLIAQLDKSLEQAVTDPVSKDATSGCGNLGTSSMKHYSAKPSAH